MRDAQKMAMAAGQNAAGKALAFIRTPRESKTDELC